MINKLKTVKRRYACEDALRIKGKFDKGRFEKGKFDKGRFEKGKFDKENRRLSL